MSTIKSIVTGAGGRMGRTLIRAIAEQPDITLVAALEEPESPFLGHDATELAGLKPSGLEIISDIGKTAVKADVIIDFSFPSASVEYARKAAADGLVHVIGTTGFTPDQEKQIRQAAHQAIIIKSGNMSLGVNLLAELVRKAAKALGPDFDIEILEMHHRHKVDAPSGTALLLGEAAARGRGIDLEPHSIRTRDGHTGPRPQGDIGFATLRGGSVVGDHQVILAGTGERIELAHKAEDRIIFAKGAIAAARWGLRQKPGLYAMKDILGF